MGIALARSGRPLDAAGIAETVAAFDLPLIGLDRPDYAAKVAHVAQRAREQGLTQVRAVLGGFTDPKLPARDVDVAFIYDVLHHVENRAEYLRNLAAYLKPGGRIVILDLLRHTYAEARELYADVWLGFTEIEVGRYLREAGFKGIETSIVHREAEAPNFETLLAVGEK